LPGALEIIDLGYDIPLIVLSILLRLISPLGKEKSDIIAKFLPFGVALNVDVKFFEALYLDDEVCIDFISLCKAASLGLM